MYNYEEIIKNSRELTMEKIINTATKCTPLEYKYCAWSYPGLNHGRAILHDEDSLNCYLAAYGTMHTIKMRYVLNKLFSITTFNDYEIIDWGCGQGLATICMLDKIEEDNFYDNPSRITFIDASYEALERTKLHASIKLKNSYTDIEYINAEIDNNFSNYYELNTYSDIVVHLLSNIVDVQGISLPEIARNIRETGKINYIVCAGHAMTETYVDCFCNKFYSARINELYNINVVNKWSLPNGYSFGADLRIYKYE